MDITQIIASICFFIGLPTVVGSFVYLIKKNKYKLQIEQCKKEILQLEIENSKMKIELLVEEGKKYDKIINAE